MIKSIEGKVLSQYGFPFILNNSEMQDFLEEFTGKKVRISIEVIDEKYQKL